MRNKLKFKVISTSLLSVGLMFAPAAMAASASASLWSITITAVPLEPGAFFAGGGESIDYNAVAFNSDPYSVDLQSSAGGALASVPYASASASVSSGGMVSITVDALQTTTLSPAHTQLTSGNGGTVGGYSFTTSGSMAVYITANYSIFADPGDGSTYGEAYSSVTLSSNFSNSRSGGNTTSYDTHSENTDNVSSTADYYYNHGVDSDSGLLSAGIVTAGTGIGYIGWSAGSYAGQYMLSLYVPVPIPEPETYAMLLAGLGLLGFMARRRKV